MTLLFLVFLLMTTNSFPLLKLPMIPCKLVCKLLGIDELIKLALTSHRTQMLLKSYKLHVAKLAWVFSDREAEPKAWLGNAGPPFYSYMRLYVYFPHTGKQLLYHFCGNCKFGNVLFPVNTFRGDGEFRVFGRRKYWKTDPGAMDIKFLEKLSNIFNDIFFIDAYSVYYYGMKDFDLFNSFVWELSKSFTRVAISRLKMSEENMKLLFNEVKIDDLTLNIKSDLPLEIRFRLNQPTLKIENCSYLTIEDIVDSSCEQIKVQFKINVEIEQLVEMVTLWKTGDKLQNIEKMELRLFKTKRESDLEKFAKQMKCICEESSKESDDEFLIKRITDGKELMTKFGGRTFRMILKVVPAEEKNEEEEEEEEEEEDEDEDEDEDEKWEEEYELVKFYDQWSSRRGKNHDNLETDEEYFDDEESDDDE